jgi:hypothetical protein
MRVESFLKAAAVLGLWVMAAGVWLRWEGTVHAQGATAGMQFAVTPVGYSFFDPRTGEVFEYRGTDLVKKYRMARPGQPLVKE